MSSDVVFVFVFLVCGFRHRIVVWWVVETNHGFLLFLWRPMWADFLLLKASFILIRSKWWNRGFCKGNGYLLKRITLFTHSFPNRKGFSNPQHWILHFVWLTQHRFGVSYLEIPVVLFYISRNKLYIKKKKNRTRLCYGDANEIKPVYPGQMTASNRSPIWPPYLWHGKTGTPQRPLLFISECAPAILCKWWVNLNRFSSLPCCVFTQYEQFVAILLVFLIFTHLKLLHYSCLRLIVLCSCHMDAYWTCY